MPVYAIDSNPRLPMNTDLKGLRELLKVCEERENYEQAAAIKRTLNLEGMSTAKEGEPFKRRIHL